MEEILGDLHGRLSTLRRSAGLALGHLGRIKWQGKQCHDSEHPCNDDSGMEYRHTSHRNPSTSGCSTTTFFLVNSWLGGRDSNPDRQIQSLQSYRWTTSQHFRKELPKRSKVLAPLGGVLSIGVFCLETGLGRFTRPRASCYLQAPLVLH